jgi:hypothetical protein
LPNPPNIYGEGGFNIDPKIWALRKALGAEKIPEPKDKESIMFMPFNRIKNINFLGIGIREDGEISERTHERI